MSESNTETALSQQTALSQETAMGGQQTVLHQQAIVGGDTWSLVLKRGQRLRRLIQVAPATVFYWHITKET